MTNMNNCTADSAPSYATAFDTYHQRGWPAIPLKRGTKSPPPKGFTGDYGAISSYADMQAWAEDDDYRDGNLAIRFPRSVIGLDVDHYDDKRGGDTLDEAEKRWGKLPPTYRSTSRDDGISGIRLYRIPEGVKLCESIVFVDPPLGGIEICQFHHRYAVCWPSIHNTTGKMYQWIKDYTPDHSLRLPDPLAALGATVMIMDQPPALDDIPDLPAAWLDALAEDARNDAAVASDFDAAPPEILTKGEPSSRVTRKLGEALSELFGSKCRHDEMRNHVLGLLRCGKNGEPGVRQALNALCEAFVNRVSKDRAGGEKETTAEFKRMVYGTDKDAKRKQFSASMLKLLADTSYDDDDDTTSPRREVSQTDDAADDFEDADDEPTTWEPIDLEPCLSGEKTQPQACLGIYRSDGVQLIYPGREHAVLGDTESGKTWYALGCVVSELNRCNTVVYIHYEEPDETSTIERLLLLGVDKDVIRKQFRFYGPMRPVRKEWLQPLLDFNPSLVIHDGVNEAMSLHSNIIKDVEGASEFRRRLVLPFTRAGIATLACDHMPLIKDRSRIAAYGSVHKGNALDGTRIQLENFKPFGRGKRGVSNVFVTKDRPGFLRANGKSTNTPGKTFMGVLAVDDMTEQPEFQMRFYAPRDLDDDDETSNVETTDSRRSWRFRFGA
jgi:hypothetical protein